MSKQRLPVYFLSHGGGPWPWVDELRGQYPVTEREFSLLPRKLTHKPRAALVISGHWEAAEFTVASAAHPGMEYDYRGFPEHTYQIVYPSPGDPQLARDVRALLKNAGIASQEDPDHGFDHGVFVPLSLMYPQADLPIVMLSIKAGYEPAQHLRAGAALAPLREDGVLIIGSGLTYHNMRGFGSEDAKQVSETFEDYLRSAITHADPAVRSTMLAEWESASAARLAHPREDHLMPLLVAAGAAGADPGRLLFSEKVMNVRMASYEFAA